MSFEGTNNVRYFTDTHTRRRNIDRNTRFVTTLFTNRVNKEINGRNTSELKMQTSDRSNLASFLEAVSFRGVQRHLCFVKELNRETLEAFALISQQDRLENASKVLNVLTVISTFKIKSIRF